MTTENEGISLGDAQAVRTTNKAILVRLDDGTEMWVPKSQLHDDSEVYDDDHEGELVVNEWWAEENGLA